MLHGKEERRIKDAGYIAYGPAKSCSEEGKKLNLPVAGGYRETFQHGWKQAEREFKANTKNCPLCSGALADRGYKGYRICVEDDCPYFDNGSIKGEI